MTTAHLVIVCASALAVAVVVARTVLSIAAKRSELDRFVALHSARAAQPAADLAKAVELLEQTARLLTPAPIRLGHRVTVHTTDGRLINGTVLEEFPDRVVLADARYITSDGEQPIPGGVANIRGAQEVWRQEHDSPAGEA